MTPKDTLIWMNALCDFADVNAYDLVFVRDQPGEPIEGIINLRDAYSAFQIEIQPQKRKRVKYQTQRGSRRENDQEYTDSIKKDCSDRILQVMSERYGSEARKYHEVAA